MRRIHLFLALTIISIASLVAITVAGYYVLTSAQTSYYNGQNQNWMGQMWQGMGGMMGNQAAPTATQNAAAPYFGVAFIAAIAIAIVGIIGVVYFALFPEIRINRTLTQPAIGANIVSAKIAVPTTTTAAAPETLAYDSVSKTLTTDERKVIEVLKKHQGKYLQKYIRSEVGLSRLQTHRIVARLADRGIVTLEKTGNTNNVLLANWLN